MKKVILSTLLMFFSLALVTPTFANENKNPDQVLEDLTQEGEIIYQDEEITVTSFGNDPEIAEAISNHPNSVRSFEPNLNNKDVIMPMGAIGSGGWSDITAGDSGRVVYWSVKPTTLWPYHFEGYVKLRYHSGFKRDAPISGMGALGSTLSGTVTMNKNNGGVAYLSGTAYSLTFDKYKVLPGVHVSFRPN
ncbi:hypothetical protein [Bacillus sp. CGMCC 1.16541]|uniref:hypothetical protein n=1 Tax=Bacillus sp. CGMCC 1.16541 TaxID=2185143 RepID=UPI000D72AA1B|nr:hypothetical protein [Bacillus sp. CGMCC 1.16541]